MKTKNKKLFALLMLPAVIAMIVLPLCSFTTTNDSAANVYNPRLKTNVQYCYHRVTSTLDEHYYGNIPNINQTMVSSIAFGDESSIKAFASDYLMSGSASFNYIGQGASSYPSYYSIGNEDLLLARVSVQSDSTASYFTGLFSFEGVLVPGETEMNSLKDIYITLVDDNSLPVSLSELNCYVSYTLATVGNSISYRDHGATHTFYGLDVSDYQNAESQIILNEILNKDLELYSSLLGDFDYISNISFKFYYEFEDEHLYPGFSGILIEDILYSDYSADSDYISKLAYQFGNKAGFDNGYEGGLQQGYDIGYDTGYNVGLSDVSGVWGNLGDFLTDSVGAFLDFELWDGFSIRAILVIFVSAMLLIGFLKIFAGG